ncbi:HlyD family secretion protein [Rheinheimera sp.]|uniref:HlyD family secretion protein n=1 Tax=Rheinheimera sp. TaxID=1869214 RepID=UPI003AF90A82
MTQGLFRPHAVQHQSSRLEGSVVVLQPVSASLLTLLLVAAVSLALLFLSQASFDRRETVAGYLKPISGQSQISAPRSGVISQLLVQDGTVVQQGQPLLALRVQGQLEGGRSLAETLLQGIAQQRQLLQLRYQQINQQYQQQQQELEARLASGLLLLEQIRNQQRLTEQRIQLQSERLNDLRKLRNQGAISQDSIKNQQEQIFSLQQLLSEHISNEQNQLNYQQQLTGQLARLPSEQAQQQASLQQELAQLQQQRVQLKADEELVLTAPVSGRVTSLWAELGSQVQNGGSLLTLVPLHSELTAVLLVPTRAYGFVRPGQAARLRFDAFPYQRFGTFQGKVIKTAQAIVLPGDIAMPLSIQEPVYRVEVQLGSQSIRAYNKEMPLQSGMLLSADVVLENRSLLAWLFEPLLSLRGRL